MSGCVYVCVGQSARVGSCAGGFAGSAAGPCGCDWAEGISVSFSLFPVVVGLLPLVVASLVWRDLCCLLTWCLPAQLCLLSKLEEWLACTPDPPPLRRLLLLLLLLTLLCYTRQNLFFFCSVVFPITCRHASVGWYAQRAL